METWDKSTVVEWFKAHKGEDVVIRVRGTMMRVQGRVGGVDRIDACSSIIEESELLLDDDNLHVGLTFHDESLGVQLTVRHRGTEQVAVSMPMSMPYAQLRLVTGEELEKTASEKRGSGEQSEESEFSPYELLH